MRSTCLSIVLLVCCPVIAGENVDDFVKFSEFELEKTKLKNIISVLGETEIHNKGDASGSYTGICYFYPKQNVTAYYESGEMGASTILLSYRFLRGNASAFPCKTVDDQGRTQFTLSGLEIGQSLKMALAVLPLKPYSVYGTTYTYWNKIPFTEIDFARTGANRTDNPEWDDMVTIELYEDAGIISGFGVSRLISW